MYRVIKATGFEDFDLGNLHYNSNFWQRQYLPTMKWVWYFFFMFLMFALTQILPISVCVGTVFIGGGQLGTNNFLLICMIHPG